MFRKGNATSLRIFSAVILSVLLISGIFAVRVYAAPLKTTNVAYVTDASGASYEGLAGSNIWENAVAVNSTDDCLPSHTSPCTYRSVTFTDINGSTVTGVSSFSGFDTVLLYQVCDIGSKPTLMNAVNSFLINGGKVVFFDGDWCAPGDGGAPNYSTFNFPFNSSNPGPQGSDKTLTFVETENLPATLTRGLAVGDGGTGGLGGSNDAVGDSNTFTSFDSHWCSALEGINALNKQGIQEAYARTSAGGLVVYNGQDFAVSFGPNIYQKTVFDNIFDQPFNPDSLPCNVVASGITLAPPTATNDVGSNHTVSATVLDSNHSAILGATVTFNLTAGPNAGTTGTSLTNASGRATFTYVGAGGAGTDTIVASFTDANNTLHTSNTVTKTWQLASTTSTSTSSTNTTTSTSTNTTTSTSTNTTSTSTTNSTSTSSTTSTNSTSTSSTNTTTTSSTSSTTTSTSTTATTTVHGVPEFGISGVGVMLSAAVVLLAVVLFRRGFRLTTNARV